MGGCHGCRRALRDRTAEELLEEFEELCRGYDRQTGAAQVTAQQLQAWLDDPAEEVVVFDVRRESEHRVSTLPQTQLLPPTDVGMAKAMSGMGCLSFNASVPEAATMPARAKVVCHCTAGLRSGYAAIALQEEWRRQGVERTVFNLHGGIISWVNAGGAVVDPQTGERRSEVHTFGAAWRPYVLQSANVHAVTLP